jgi:RNA polymerase sigma factor (sigma-70 family)
MRQLHDAELWSTVRHGDSEAFGVLFDRHADALYRYCRRWTGDPVAAEDLVSITFLEAWRRREVILADDAVRAWFYGIARNVIRNQRRSRRRHRDALKRFHDEQQPDLADDVAERLAARDDAKRALSRIARLPDSERDVWALCQWSGLSSREVAVALGITEGAVRTRLSRARARLAAPTLEDNPLEHADPTVRSL